MEPTTRIELVTSSLPRMCSTDWATWAYEFTKRTSNFHDSRIISASNHIFKKNHKMERETGFEPATLSLEGWRSSPWAIPALKKFESSTILHFPDGGGRIRTSVGFAGRFTVCSLWPLGYPSGYITKCWSWRWDSNPQPADYKSAALPVELRQPTY